MTADKIVIPATKAQSLAALCSEVIYMTNAARELCQMNPDADGSIVSPETLESVSSALAEAAVRKLDVVIKALGGTPHGIEGGDHD